MDPKATLVAVASKTFTTTETLMNAESALEWLRDGGVEDPYGQVIALTAKPEKAMEWGVDQSRILPFAESVGGRYSLWCSIGFPVAAALGWAAFEELLEGAAEMDRHFRTAPLGGNAPVLAAFADLYYAQVRKCQTRAALPMTSGLRLLPDYLQQLEMESNGKSVTADGAPLDYPKCAGDLGRRGDRCAACGVPVAASGDAPDPGGIHREQDAQGTISIRRIMKPC
jgi:glucose-6-phosphate isomerase